MLFARIVSIEGCLFMIFMAVLFMTLNIPLKNILGRVMKGHDNLVAIIEACVIIFVARKLAQWSGPAATKLIQDITSFISELIIDILVFLRGY